jgi:GNAT superfamily N-acetyltransferase
MSRIACLSNSYKCLPQIPSRSGGTRSISRANEEYGVKFDIATILEADMKELGKFMPPHGRLLLCYAEDQLAGIACLKQLTPTMGEIKRMYVRPAHRKQGLGHALTHRLIEEASQISYQRVRLDSARFMHDAHHLYRTAGFSEIDAYEGSEIPKEFQPHWIFMELELQGRVPPRSVRKLGIRALKLMMGKRMCLRKCKFQFFLTLSEP